MRWEGRRESQNVEDRRGMGPGAKAGVAIGGVKNTINFRGVFPYSSSTTKVGWTVGGGVEHLLSRNWTIGLEALFVDLGKSSVTVPETKTTKFQNQAVIGRLKLNYKF